MASVGFIGEKERQLRTSNCKKKQKLSRKILAINYSAVPKKLRSATKTRPREFLSQLLPSLSGKRHVPDGVAATTDRGKKSKLNTTKGRITKDEKEVAATLNALADMFSDVSKTSNEPSETKSSTIMEVGNTATGAKDIGKLTKREGSKKISRKDAIDNLWTQHQNLQAASYSSTFVDSTSKSAGSKKISRKDALDNLWTQYKNRQAASYSSTFVDSTSKSVKVDMLGKAQQFHLAIDKQSNTPVIQADSRQKTPPLDVIPGGEQAIAPLQVATPSVQYGRRNFHPKEDRSFGSYQPPTMCPSRDQGSKTEGSCRRLPAWLENAISTPKPRVNGGTVDKTPCSEVKPKASWKRCTAHVYISRLVQVMQMSRENEGLLEKSHLTTCREADAGNGVLFSNSMINSGVEKNSAEIQNAILLHKQLLQEQQLPFNASVVCSSSKQGSECQLDGSAGINAASNKNESVKRLHMSHLQSQNLFLQSRNSSSNIHGYTSAAAAQQAQLHAFHFKSHNVAEPFQQHSGSQHQKWPFQIQDRYNYGGVSSAVPYVAAWQDGGRHSSLQLNHGQPLFPHMHPALGPNYQPVTPPPHFTSPQLHNMWVSATQTHL